MDGSPVRILAFRIPKNPTKDRWEPTVISENLHVVHNIFPMEKLHGRQFIFAASYEGVTLLLSEQSQRVGEGNQANPQSNRGASEVCFGAGLLAGGFLATIEPWHGHQVVVYTRYNDKSKLFDRHVIDEQLKWGHAIQCADLYGDHKNNEIIVGVRDNLSEKPGERRGVRIYKALERNWTKWARHIVEEGGVAVEALAVADLNGDGRRDIVAAGRQTGNIRIYWNEGIKSK